MGSRGAACRAPAPSSSAKNTGKPRSNRRGLCGEATACAVSGCSLRKPLSELQSAPVGAQTAEPRPVNGLRGGAENVHPHKVQVPLMLVAGDPTWRNSAWWRKVCFWCQTAWLCSVAHSGGQAIWPLCLSFLVCETERITTPTPRGNTTYVLFKMHLSTGGEERTQDLATSLRVLPHLLFSPAGLEGVGPGPTPWAQALASPGSRSQGQVEIPRPGLHLPALTEPGEPVPLGAG